MSTRHRDRPSGLNRDYYATGGDIYDDPRDYASQSPPPRSRRHGETLPRRGKSERRRAPSPELADDRYEKPSRHHSRRDPRPPPKVVNSGRGRYPVVEPMDAPYASSPPPRTDAPSSRRDREHRRGRDVRDSDDDRPRDRRSRRAERNSMPPPSRDPYDRTMDPRAGRPPRDHPVVPEPRRRTRNYSPPPDPRARDRDPYDPRRSRGRERYPSPTVDDRYGPLPRRPKSHGRTQPPLDVSPTRGRPPPAQAGRPRAGDKLRRNSMPASARPAAGTPWWQNKMVQSGARTAFTAGAQAAFRSRGEKGPWLGPKGAKVATAALSAAVMDGFLGSKYPDAPEVNLAREGGDAAVRELGKRWVR